MKKQIGQDVIKMYEQYKNTQSDWKKTELGGYMLDLPSHYQPIKILGKGSYGVVVAAKNHNKNGELVAIKKMINVFEHKTFARRTLRQLRLLRLIIHQNVIGIKTIILPPSREEFDDLYVVFELMDTDLTNILRSQQKLTKEHHKFFMYQILRALKYVHSSQVVHRDLKPRNILLDANCDLKLCDFGLSRPLIKETTANGLTDYVTTRWYRAPQLLLGQNNYTPAVDIWSLGCMYGQILLKKPILTANSTKQQISLICECLGMPDIDVMKNVSGESKLFIKKLCMKNKKPPTFQKMTENIPPQEKQLLKQLLVFEPERRITAAEALKLPYFKDLHLEEDEPIGKPINSFQFQFEDYNVTTQQLKDMLYEEILLYNFPSFAEAYETKKKNKKSLISHILSNSNSTNIDPEADDDGDQ